jgi:hypothetical protein
LQEGVPHTRDSYGSLPCENTPTAAHTYTHTQHPHTHNILYTHGGQAIAPREAAAGSGGAGRERQTPSNSRIGAAQGGVEERREVRSGAEGGGREQPGDSDLQGAVRRVAYREMEGSTTVAAQVESGALERRRAGMEMDDAGAAKVGGGALERRKTGSSEEEQEEDDTMDMDGIEGGEQTAKGPKKNRRKKRKLMGVHSRQWGHENPSLHPNPNTNTYTNPNTNLNPDPDASTAPSPGTNPSPPDIRRR